METKVKGGMMTVDLDVVDEIQDDGGETALAKVELGTLSKAGEMSGEIKSADIVMPRLNLVQNVGPMSRAFKPGQWVIGKETVLANEGELMNLVVITISKYYQEKFPKYDPNGPKPRIFATEKEVYDNKLVLEWKDDVAPTAQPVADILILIQAREVVDPVHFPLSAAGRQWAVASWTCRSTAYTRAAKTIFRARSLELRDCGLLGGLWSLCSKEATINGNLVKAPVLNLVGRNSPETIAAIKTACGA